MSLEAFSEEWKTELIQLEAWSEELMRLIEIHLCGDVIMEEYEDYFGTPRMEMVFLSGGKTYAVSMLEVKDEEEEDATPTIQ